jgi:hypothetical protein
MTEYSVGTARDHPRDPSALATKAGVSNRVNTAMNAVQAPRLNAASAATVANSRLLELRDGHHTVLVRRQP